MAEVADPEPQPGEAILEVGYAALNPADRYLAERQYPVKPPLPHILGRDGVGRVLQVGSGVNDVRVGDKRVILRGDVGGSRWGTFAERVAVPVEEPGGSSSGLERSGRAAGAALVYLTAYQALTTWGLAAVLPSGRAGNGSFQAVWG